MTTYLESLRRNKEDQAVVNAVREVLGMAPLYVAPSEPLDATLFTRPDRPTRQMHWARDSWTMLDARGPR